MNFYCIQNTSCKIIIKISKTLIGETMTKNNGKNVNGLITLRQKADDMDWMLVSPFPFLAEALAFNVMAFEWSLWEGIRFTLGPEGGTFIMGLKTEVKVKSLSHVQLFRNPWTVPHQDPLSMGILQARILEWVAISFSRGSSRPRDQTQISCIAGRRFILWATRETIMRLVPLWKGFPKWH